mgnify:FL=1
MYADVDFYRNTYYGSDASDTELKKWLSRASDDIDIATLHRIGNLSDFPEDVQTAIKKAACAQTENYIEAGSGIDGLASLSVGSFSVSASDGGKRAVLCTRATQYLAQTGLLCRAIGSAECRYPVQY